MLTAIYNNRPLNRIDAYIELGLRGFYCSLRSVRTLTTTITHNATSYTNQAKPPTVLKWAGAVDVSHDHQGCHPISHPPRLYSLHFDMALPSGPFSLINEQTPVSALVFELPPTPAAPLVDRITVYLALYVVSYGNAFMSAAGVPSELLLPSTASSIPELAAALAAWVTSLPSIALAIALVWARNTLVLIRQIVVHTVGQTVSTGILGALAYRYRAKMKTIMESTINTVGGMVPEDWVDEEKLIEMVSEAASLDEDSTNRRNKPNGLRGSGEVHVAGSKEHGFDEIIVLESLCHNCNAKTRTRVVRRKFKDEDVVVPGTRVEMDSKPLNTSETTSTNASE